MLDAFEGFFVVEHQDCVDTSIAAISRGSQAACNCSTYTHTVEQELLDIPFTRSLSWNFGGLGCNWVGTTAR